MARHHPHRHLHPHLRGRHHHHPHRTPHGRSPHDLAHHHPITTLQGRPAPPSVATRRVRSVWRFVYSWFPRAVSLGVYNCRRIAGSSSWSQHAWADAWDVTDEETVKTRRPSPYTDAIVHEISVQAGHLHITRVLWADGGAHDTHAHVDVEPERTGTPPCA